MKRLLLLCLLELLAAPVAAQLLYSVKRKGSQPSFVYGTIHLIADSAFYFPPKLEKTLAKADRLVLEINDLDNRMGAMQLMKLDSGSVFDLFSPEQADSLINWGSTILHMSPEAFRKGFSGMKPFALLQIGAQTMVKGPARYFELELMGRAATNHQTVSGLETMAYQLSLFDDIPAEKFAELVMENVRHPEESAEIMREMTRLYVAQDLEALSRLIVESESLGGETEALLFQRNRNWLPLMEELMLTQSCFFAVGAGHLGGEKGVLQLLKNAGYTVTPLSF